MYSYVGNLGVRLMNLQLLENLRFIPIAVRNDTVSKVIDLILVAWTYTRRPQLVWWASWHTRLARWSGAKTASSRLRPGQ